MDARRRFYLSAMGIQGWVPREAGPRPAADPAPGNAATTPETSTGEGTGTVPPADLDWDGLAARVAACTACELHRTRTQTVFGVGDRNAPWMVVGEAPGADEDRQGEPFVGRAGRLLNAMLRAVGLSREAVYIANILKCRPPNNRDPRPEEVVCCEGFLRRQVELVRPRLILAVGRVAAQNLLKVDTPIKGLRGRVHAYGETGIPVVVTYHPAYLLRSPLEKRRAWDDLCLALEVLGRTPGAGG